MGLRAYLMIDVVNDMDQRQFIRALRELEETQGVDFVDPVFGDCDLVVMVEAPTSIEALASKIRAKTWVKNLEVLRIVSAFQRHRAPKKQSPEISNDDGLYGSGF